MMDSNCLIPCRQHICQKNLGALADDEELSSKIITGGETWVYHLDLPTKQESMQLIQKASPPPKMHDRTILPIEYMKML
jgi:hypothetical protein